jgi:hypothetical protein
MNSTSRAATLDELKRVLRDTLQLGPRAAALTAQ